MAVPSIRAQAAERLLAGSYAAFAAAPGSWGPRVAQTMIAISKLLYNFMEWRFRSVSEGVFEIECSQAEAYPEAARHTAQGFLRWFAEHAAGRPMHVTSARARPDLVVFRIAER